MGQTLTDFVEQPDTLYLQTRVSHALEDLVATNENIMAGRPIETGVVPIYLAESELTPVFQALGNDYHLFPEVLSPMGEASNEAAGISAVLAQENLALSGQGVIIGIVDTGIDVTKPCFRYEDGSSKIVALWDQSLSAPHSEAVYYGSDYGRAQLTALSDSGDGKTALPGYDEDGHGTFLASVAAGRETEGGSLGAAPGAELAVVKLRRLAPYFVKALLLAPDNPNYFSSIDVILGMAYLYRVAERRGRPLVLLLGIGSNDSGHDGGTMLEEYITYLSGRPGVCVVSAAGNEAGARHHAAGSLFRTGSVAQLGVEVTRSPSSFLLDIYMAGYDKFSIGLKTPTGERLTRVPQSESLSRCEDFLFESARVCVTYYRAENTLARLAFFGVTEGVWQVFLYGDAILDGTYHAWLPISYQQDGAAEFTDPVTEFTIVYPSTAQCSMVSGAYDARDNSLYAKSSWGPGRLPRVLPDFVAPGVLVEGVYPIGAGTMTGSSAAAAVTAGAAAIMMEWGVVQGNSPGLDGELMRRLFMSGARRSEDETYPNPRWGYGRLDLYRTFWTMRG